jgi:hypothetical protein
MYMYVCIFCVFVQVPQSVLRTETVNFDDVETSSFKQLKIEDSVPTNHCNNRGRYGQPITLGIVKTRPEKLESKQGTHEYRYCLC